VHVVERLGKIELLGRLTTTRGILALRGEREHEVSVYDLAVRPRLEFEVLDDASALIKVEDVSDGD
jgi:hypothetical protein